jgi:hypothetical protein
MDDTMIDPATTRELVDHLRQIEDRLERLLVSGWRLGQVEAADLLNEADLLEQSDLSSLGARVRAVAQADGAADALHKIALASSACRLLRLRLPTDSVPDGWAPVTPSRPKARSNGEVLLPLSRLLVDGREVWACSWPAGRQWLLLEPPFPPEPTSTPPQSPARPRSIFGRLGRQIVEAFGGAATPPAPWVHHQLRGRLVWQARYPLGATGEVNLCTLDDAAWVTEPDAERYGIRAFLQKLRAGALTSGATAFPGVGGLRLMELDRTDPAAYIWLDATATAVFASAPSEKVWALVWTGDSAITPLALLTPGGGKGPSRLTHLIPGSPSHVLVGG